MISKVAVSTRKGPLEGASTKYCENFHAISLTAHSSSHHTFSQPHTIQPGAREERKGNGGLMPKIDGTIMIKVLLKICLFNELNLV